MDFSWKHPRAHPIPNQVAMQCHSEAYYYGKNIQRQRQSQIQVLLCVAIYSYSCYHHNHCYYIQLLLLLPLPLLILVLLLQVPLDVATSSTPTNSSPTSTTTAPTIVTVQLLQWWLSLYTSTIMNFSTTSTTILTTTSCPTLLKSLPLCSFPPPFGRRWGYFVRSDTQVIDSLIMLIIATTIFFNSTIVFLFWKEMVAPSFPLSEAL